MLDSHIAPDFGVVTEENRVGRSKRSASDHRFLALERLPLRFGGGEAWLPYAAAAAAILGHVYPVFHGFRGGKGAGTLVGVLLVLWPLAVAVMIGAWLLVLVASGYVGLSTILAGAMLVPLALATEAGPERLVFAVAVALFLVFTHRSNLARLRAGVEPRFERARLLRRGRA